MPDNNEEVKYKLDSPNAWHHGDTDSSPACPNCYNHNNNVMMGQIVVDGSPRPAYKCGSCNRMYSDLPAPIKVLADEAKKNGAKTVGFKTGQPITAANLNNATSISVNQQNLENKLDEVKNTIYNLMYEIQRMTQQVTDIASQNHELMDKLSKDPLAHMRKSITEFDLK